MDRPFYTRTAGTDSLRYAGKLTPTGSEQLQDSREKTASREKSGAVSGASGGDPALASVILAWPRLSGEAKAQIQAIIDQAR
jgi:hypothetical protein